MKLHAVPTAVDPERQAELQAQQNEEQYSFLPDQVTPGGVTPQATPPSDDALVLPDQKGMLENVYGAVAGTDPERAAKVVGLARKTGEPEAFVDKNLEHMQKAVTAPPGSLFKSIEDQYPGTTKFLSVPQNMAVAHDDLENLSQHEGLIQRVKDAWNFEKSAFESGALQEELGFIRYGQIEGKQTAGGYDPFRFGAGMADRAGATSSDPNERAQQIAKRLEELERSRPQGFGLKRAAYGATEFLPQILGGLGYGAKYGAPLAGAAAVAGAATGVGEAAIVPTAFALGMGTGEAEYNYKVMTGMAYDQLLKIKDANGQGLPDNVAKVAAISMGAATAGLSFVKLNALLESVPGGKDFLSRFTAEAGEKVLENPDSYGMALKNFAQNYVQSVAHGVGAMEGIAAVNMAGAEAAKYASGQPFEHITPGDAASEFAMTGVDSALTFGLMALPGTSWGLMHDTYAARKAAQAKEFYLALGNTAESAKLRARLPEAHREFVENLTKDTPVENIYVPVEAAAEYFQSKNIPIEKAMEELGVSKSYLEARETGGDIQIPLAAWAEKIVGTEHYQGLADDIKFSPEDLTSKQAALRRSEIREEIAALEEKIQAESQGKVSPEESAAKVGEGVADQLKAAGASSTEARTSAQLHEAFFRRLGEQLGVDPQELSQRFPLQINGPEAEMSRARMEGEARPEVTPEGGAHPEAIAAQAAYKQDVLERIRAEVEQGQVEKGSLSYDQDGNVTGRTGAVSTYPEYFKGKGYTKKETLKAIDKHLAGEKLSDKQTKIIGDLYHSSGYDPESQRPAADPFLQGPVSYNQSAAEQSIAPPFYSKLVQTVEQKMGGSASVEQINGMLKDIKPEERKWMGLDEFLKGKEKVSKQELLDFLRGNQLDIKEVTKEKRDANIDEFIPDEMASEVDRLSKEYEDTKEPLRKERDKLIDRVFKEVKNTDEALNLVKTIGQVRDGELFDEAIKQLRERAPNSKPEKYIEAIKDSRKKYDDYIASRDRFNEAKERYESQDKTKYSSYALPGGENYREVLFTLPPKSDPEAISSRLKEIEHILGHTSGPVEEREALKQEHARLKQEQKEVAQNQYHSGHWDERNVLAHTRLSDRVDSEGKKVLHIEEIQSDWHQEGRKKGYKGEQSAKDYFGYKDEYWNSLTPEEKAAAEADMREHRKTHQEEGVPDAPFKKTWHEFVLKRLIREAAEKGYDKIAWTPGEAQSERYSLSKHVDEIRAEKGEDGTIHVVGYKDGDSTFSEKGSSSARIAEILGKDLAEKINSQAPGERKLYSGVDLKVGGEGMKGFYDKMIPEFLNKFGKKYEAKVGETEVSTSQNGLRVASAGAEGFDVIDENEKTLKIFPTREVAEQYVKEKASADTKLHSLEITPKLREAALNEGFSLFQPGDEGGPRGRIRIGQSTFNIDLFKTADRSTFLHETGHYFLEVMGKVAGDANAPKEVKDDYATLLNWLGVESPDQIKVEHHEKFARGFEAYLMEGNAPSPTLRKSFERFKNWLISVYKDLRNLNVELSDDIRGVMDRMLASREEIERARQSVGYTAEEIPGITPEIAKRIKDLQEQAREIAEQHLIEKQMGELKEKRDEFLNTERERLTADAEAQIKKEVPLFKALEEFKADTGAKRPMDLVRSVIDGKAKPDMQARFEVLGELHGFASGADLAKQLLDAHESNAFDKEVKRRVDLEMLKYADMRHTDAIKVEALKAIHNDGGWMTELLALERDAMMELVHKESVRKEASRRRRAEAKVEAKAAGDNAREIISQKPIKEAGKYTTYLTAERNAAAKVAKALAQRDYAAAAEFKRQQMLNHALASEAIQARAEAEKALEYLSSFERRGSDMKDMPYGFIRQIDQLLSLYGIAEARPEDTETLIQVAKDMMDKGEDFADIANATGLKLDPSGQWVPETLSDFVTRANDNYYAMQLPDSLMVGTEKSYKDLRVSELRELRAAVKLISEVGKKYDRFLDEFIKMDVKQAAQKFRISIEKTVGTPYAESLAIGSKHGSKAQEKINSILNLPDTMIPDMVNILTLTHFLDGGKEDGLAKDLIYRPLKRAEDRKIQRYEKMRETVNGLFEKYFKPDELASYKEKREMIPQLGRFMTREEILAMALNWGNEGNRDRIRRGFNLSDDSIHQILGRLDKKEWDFVQDVWDHLDSYWPEIVAQEMKIRGVEPARVEAAPVDTRFGSYRGGYYPIAYDFERSADAYRNAEQKNALYKQFSSTTAHTDTGHTQERVTRVTRPVRLSLDVLFNHLENVVHDLEYRPAVIDVNRMLNQRDTKTALTNAIGVKGFNAINEWLKAVASDQGEFLTFADKAFRWFRFNSTFATLSYRLFTLPMDVTGNLFNGVWEIGPTRMASAMKEFVMNPSETKEFVESKSERMRFRATNRDRDIMEMSKKWSGKDSAFKQYGFLVQAIADEAISYPLWAEVYKKALAEHGEDKAKSIADETVSRTVGSGSMLDQVGAQRGPESKKILTMYYSWLSMMFNRAWLSGKLAGLEYRQGNMGAALGIMAKATFFAWGMQALNENFWRELFHNSQNDDEGERAKRVLGRTLQQPFAYVWVVRDIAGYGIDTAVGTHGNYRLSPMESAVETILKPFGEAAHIAFSDSKSADMKFGEDSARSAAYLLGYPQQANNLAFNLLDWSQNNGDLTWRDLLQRRTKK